MYRELFLAMFLCSLIVGLIACNQRTDVSQFITKESFEKAYKDCENSTDKMCKFRPSIAEVEKYCLEKKTTENQCKQIMDDVFQKALYYFEQHNEEMNQLTEKLKQVTEELKRKNGLK